MSAHKYELMFIADPELDERGLKKLTEQYLETVTKEGGAVENIDIWGRRKLAYEIAGKTEGNYVVVNYSAAAGHQRRTRSSAEPERIRHPYEDSSQVSNSKLFKLQNNKLQSK